MMQATYFTQDYGKKKLSVEPAFFAGKTCNPPISATLTINNNGSFQSMVLDAADLKVLAAVALAIAAEIEKECL